MSVQTHPSLLIRLTSNDQVGRVFGIVPHELLVDLDGLVARKVSIASAGSRVRPLRTHLCRARSNSILRRIVEFGVRQGLGEGRWHNARVDSKGAEDLDATRRGAGEDDVLP